MRDNPIQFAVVREDPLIEATLVSKSGAEKALVIGSGGCTALSLQALFPSLKITVVDANSAQLQLVKQKMDALIRANSQERKRLFNIGCDNQDGLNACGNFESLFRSLRNFLQDFATSRGELRDFFTTPTKDFYSGQLFANKYWPLAFELYFSNPVLEAIFGPMAVQHAAAGSYAGYFRWVFEKGLSAPCAKTNYFLHHVLLGSYLDHDDYLPLYLTHSIPSYRFEFVHNTIDKVEHLFRYDLVSISNILDWTSEYGVVALANFLSENMRPGAQLLFRQLNHDKDFARFFAPSFSFDMSLAADLLAQDRSLFYSKLNIATKL